MTSFLEAAYTVRDLVTGEVREDLPLATDDELHNTIARDDATTFTLNPYDPAVYSPGLPVTWHQTLITGKAMITQTIDDTFAQAWVVTDTDIGASTVPIAAATLEHVFAVSYLDRDVTDTFRDDVAATVAILAACDAVAANGFTVRPTPPATPPVGGVEVDLQASEGTPLLDILTARMKTVGGAEWRIFVEAHDATRRTVDKIIEVAPQVGIDRPDAVFDRDSDGRGNVESYVRKTSAGPTKLIGSTEGSAPITSEPEYAKDLLANGYPLWEQRVTFTDLADVDDPDAAIAKRTAAQLQASKNGVVLWQIVVNDDADILPGRDYAPGDTVHIDIAPQIPTDPVGGRAAVRVLGYKLNRISQRVTVEVWEDNDASSS